MIQFKALGGIVLHGPNGPAERLLGQPRRLALLSWLALAIPRGPHRRDRIVAMFWPESDEARARNSLSQSIYHLRHELEPELFVGRGPEMIGLDFARLDCDVLRFEQAASAGRWADVRAAYRGELMPGFHVSGVPEYEQWLDGERQRLATIAARAGWNAATDAERAGDAAAATDAARWAAGLVPYDEEALRRLLGVLDRAGDRAGAIEAYEAFAERLGREYGERPSPQTAVLVAQVRARRVETPAPVAAGHEPAAPAPAPEAPSARAVVPRPTPRRRLPLFALAVVLALAVPLVLLSRRSAQAVMPATRAVAVMPFATHGDPTLAYVGEGLGALLEAKLDGAGGVHLVDPHAVHALRPLRSADADDDALALAAARRLHATHYLLGDVTAVGEQVQVRAELRSIDGPGRVLTSAVVSGARDSLFALADALALRLLADVAGRHRREVQAGAAATRSLDAFRAFIDGEAAMAAGRYVEAAEQFQHAIALDSGFALAAYRGAAALDWASRSNDEIRTMLALAERGRSRLSGRQQRLLAAASAYYAQEGDSAERVLRGIVADDPDATDAWFLLGETLFHLGPARGRSWREARTAFERVIAYDPDDAESLLHMARIAAADGDRRALEAYAEAALPQLRGTVRGWELEGLRAAVSGDPARLAAFRRGLAAAPPGAAAEAARALAVYLEDVEAASSVDAIGLAGASAPRRAQYAAARGRWREALSEMRREPCPSAERGICAALHLGMATLPGVPPGDADVRELVADVERLPTAPGPSAPLYAVVVRAVTLGRLAAARGDAASWNDARAHLQALARQDPPVAGYAAWVDGAWLVWQDGDARLADGMLAVLRDPAARRRIVGVDVAWPVRMDFALALARAGHDDEALALFRSVPDASGRDLMYLPYARLGEARILARRGDVEGARRLYGRVLRLWRVADPGFQPAVAAARADSTRLAR